MENETDAQRARGRRVASAAAALLLGAAALIAAAIVTASKAPRESSVGAAPTPGTKFTGNSRVGGDPDGETVVVEPGGSGRTSATPWGVAVVVDDRTLDVFYGHLPKECWALRGIDVVTGSHSIRITLLSESTTSFCNTPLIPYRTRVVLEEPIGARTVVDGAPPERR